MKTIIKFGVSLIVLTVFFGAVFYTAGVSESSSRPGNLIKTSSGTIIFFSDFTVDEESWWPTLTSERYPDVQWLSDTIEIRQENGNDFLYMSAELPGESMIIFYGGYNQFYYAQDMGPIHKIDYQEDFIVFDNPDTTEVRITAFPFISQFNSHVNRVDLFVPVDALEITEAGWTTLSISGLQSEDFINFHEYDEGYIPHPNFSEFAPLSYFGFIRIIERLDEYDWTEQEYPEYKIGSDNFKITVHVQMPDDDPSSVVISDGSFQSGDWDFMILSASDNAGVDVERRLTGGNPGSYMNMKYDLPDPSGTDQSVIAVAYKYTGASYEVREHGMIESIDYSEDLLLLTEGALAVSIPLIFQGENIYRAKDNNYLISTQYNTWQNDKLTGLLETDFTLTYPQVSLENPNFLSGEHFYFGFGHFYSSPAAVVLEQGVDNFKVAVKTVGRLPVLEPDYHVIRTDADTHPSLVGYPPFPLYPLANDYHPDGKPLKIYSTEPGPDIIIISSDSSYVIVQDVSKLPIGEQGQRYFIYTTTDGNRVSKLLASDFDWPDFCAPGDWRCYWYWAIMVPMSDVSWCLVETSLKIDASKQGQVDTLDINLLYHIRDDVMSDTEFGSRYVDMYYNTPEILKIIVLDRPDLGIQALRMTETLQPALRSLVNGGNAVVTQEQMDAVSNFFSALSAEGSDSLQALIAGELDRLGPLDNYVGMPVKDAAALAIGEPGTNVNDNGRRIPTEFVLYQNYPNPFNPATLIRYSVAERSMVTLKVYDITGREVVTIVNEEKVPGTYQILFNARSLASGVYYYSLRAGSFYEVKRMVYVK